VSGRTLGPGIALTPAGPPEPLDQQDGKMFLHVTHLGNARQAAMGVDVCGSLLRPRLLLLFGAPFFARLSADARSSAVPGRRGYGF
jgi:hypothetical protein